MKPVARTFRNTRQLLVLLSALGFLVACSSNDSVYTGHFRAFGGQVDVTIVGIRAGDARQAVETLAQDFAYMEDAWNPRRAGPLARTNQLLASGESFTAPPSILPLIDRSRELEKLSGGLINPALGRLHELWAFDADDLKDFRPPDDAAVAAMMEQRPALSDITVDEFRLRSGNGAVALDFREFLDGYAIDQAILRLLELGIGNALVNVGGDLRAIGSRAGHPWQVAIRRSDGTGVLATLDILGDESVVTVGAFEMFRDFRGRRYHHLLDPRTGWPAETTLSVTVVHRDATTAHAAATALFVAGPEHWPAVAARMGVDQVILIDAQGTAHLTPRLEPRLRFMGRTPAIRIESTQDSDGTT